jgi:uncharacterized protein YjbJ (UPF0337 family)
MYGNVRMSGFRAVTIRPSTYKPRKNRIDMNLDRSYGTWKQVRGKVKQQWGALIGDPATVVAGTRELLAGKVQEQRGISKQEADRQLQDFMSRHRNWSDPSVR